MPATGPGVVATSIVSPIQMSKRGKKRGVRRGGKKGVGERRKGQISLASYQPKGVLLSSRRCRLAVVARSIAMAASRQRFLCFLRRAPLRGARLTTSAFIKRSSLPSSTRSPGSGRPSGQVDSFVAQSSGIGSQFLEHQSYHNVRIYLYKW